MKVKELIEILKQFPKDATVCLEQEEGISPSIYADSVKVDEDGDVVIRI